MSLNVKGITRKNQFHDFELLLTTLDEIQADVFFLSEIRTEMGPNGSLQRWPGIMYVTQLLYSIDTVKLVSFYGSVCATWVLTPINFYVDDKQIGVINMHYNCYTLKPIASWESFSEDIWGGLSFWNDTTKHKKQHPSLLKELILNQFFQQKHQLILLRRKKQEKRQLHRLINKIMHMYTNEISSYTVTLMWCLHTQYYVLLHWV